MASPNSLSASIAAAGGVVGGGFGAVDLSVGLSGAAATIRPTSPVRSTRPASPERSARGSPASPAGAAAGASPPPATLTPEDRRALAEALDKFDEQTVEARKKELKERLDANSQSA